MKHTNVEVVELPGPQHEILAATFIVRSNESPGCIVVVVGGQGYDDEKEIAELIAALIKSQSEVRPN